MTLTVFSGNVVFATAVAFVVVVVVVAVVVAAAAIAAAIVLVSFLCMSVTLVHPAKTNGRNEVPFGAALLWSQVILCSVDELYWLPVRRRIPFKLYADQQVPL